MIKRAMPPEIMAAEDSARKMAEEVRRAFSINYSQSREIARQQSQELNMLHYRIQRIPEEHNDVWKLLNINIPPKNHERSWNPRTKSYSA